MLTSLLNRMQVSDQHPDDSLCTVLVFSKMSYILLYKNKKIKKKKERGREKEKKRKKKMRYAASKNGEPRGSNKRYIWPNLQCCPHHRDTSIIIPHIPCYQPLRNNTKQNLQRIAKITILR